MCKYETGLRSHSQWVVHALAFCPRHFSFLVLLWGFEENKNPRTLWYRFSHLPEAPRMVLFFSALLNPGKQAPFFLIQFYSHIIKLIYHIMHHCRLSNHGFLSTREWNNYSESTIIKGFCPIRKVHTTGDFVKIPDFIKVYMKGGVEIKYIINATMKC